MANKIYLDKYYTPIDLAINCINKTINIIGKKNISEIIEPSAGNGSFSLNIEGCLAYDIEPQHETILKQDFLKLKLSYKKNRLVIGNPPFGEKMYMAKLFFKKSAQIADYIAFILPISQLNNQNSLYHFDLIYSEDLGIIKYSDRELHCCFNIYKRPASNLNKQKREKLNSIKIYRQDSKRYNLIDNYDLRLHH